MLACKQMTFPRAALNDSVDRYYFAIILASRRFFTLHVLPIMKQTPRGTETPTTAASTSDEKTKDLAHVCLGAAKSLAEVGFNASRSERSVNNMPLMKCVTPTPPNLSI